MMIPRPKAAPYYGETASPRTGAGRLLVDKSRVKGDFHARFRGSVGVGLPHATRPRYTGETGNPRVGHRDKVKGALYGWGDRARAG